LPGFREFRAGFTDDQLANRLGQRYPLVPDLEPERATATTDEALQWIGNATLASWVYKLFRVEKTASREEAAATAARANARLYEFLGAVRERTQRLVWVISRGLLNQPGARPLFAGCYVAGTGRASTEHAFVAGVFRLLIDDKFQNSLCWTQEALDEEATCQRMIWIGTGILSRTCPSPGRWQG
jgi:hypothetical protein